MPTLEITEAQASFLDALRDAIEDELVGPYGTVRRQDAMQYLIDNYGEPDELLTDAADTDATVDPGARVDTAPTEGTVDPDIDPSEGESQVEIEAKVENEYAVDRHPSDHRTDEEPDGAAAAPAAESAPDVEHRDDDDHEGHTDHHGGAPAGGWDARGFGAETTWFMLGPITVAAAGAVALGIAPRAMVFLAVIQRVVFEVTGVVV